MRIRIRNDLPVHPRNPRLTNTIRILLNFRIPSRSRKRRPLRTIVIGSVKVAHSPFLHDQLLACFLRFLDVGCEGIFGQVADAVGVDCDYVESRAGEVGVLDGGCEVRGAAGGDENGGAALQVGFDGGGDGALPFC